MSTQIKTILSVPFMENGYVVYDDENADTQCVVIDPGLEPQKYMSFLEEKNLTPVALLCTHGHADHMAGIGPLKERFPDADIVIGVKDAKKLIDADENLSAIFGIPVTVPPADVLLFAENEQPETLHYAGLEFEARHTPGHACGHTIFRLMGMTPEVVFVGDLIFQRSVGRTDFPDGNPVHLADSIHTQVYTLPDDTLLYSGHGDKTTVAAEKNHNPYVPGV